jgi:HSP20 family protein
MSGLVPFNTNRPARGRSDFFNMLDDFFNDDTWLPRNLFHDSFKIDVKETDKEYVVEADLPGVKKEDIRLELDDGRLSISVEHEESKEEKLANYLHRERRYGSMQRSVYLADVRQDNVAAKFEGGVLTVSVPKADRPDKNRAIDIQ